MNKSLKHELENSLNQLKDYLYETIQKDSSDTSKLFLELPKIFNNKSINIMAKKKDD